MAMIPVSYNLRSMKVRYTATSVAVLCIAGVVAVLIAMLAMSNGFRATLKASGLEDNAMIRRGGSSSEMESAIDLESAKIIADAPGIARNSDNQPIVSPEVVVIANLPMINTGTDANVQVRGVSQQVLDVRNNVTVTSGRMFSPGTPELLAGKNASALYAGLKLGESIKMGGQTWTVVGIFDSDGSAFDSEIWCDSYVLNQTYNRPTNIFQSVTVKLDSTDALQTLKDNLTADPRLDITVEREIDYYSRQSEMVAKLINVLGFLVTAIMGIGAIFGALNIMYAAVASRSSEIATLRALGFGKGAIITSFVLESVIISIIGAVIGSICILPLNGFTASTINWQTFSHLAFAFKITPDLMVSGLICAVILGIAGGIFPAVRAARQSITTTLRGL